MNGAIQKLTTAVCVLFVLSATSQAALIEVGFEASEGYNNGDETVGTSVTGGSFRYSGRDDAISWLFSQ